MTASCPIVLLGPQRHDPRVRDTLEKLAPSGNVALIAAGWEEREAEDEELVQHLGRPVRNLAVYQRGEEVFAEDPELLEGMQTRHDELRSLQDLYRLRLSHALAAARELFALGEEDPLVPPELDDAIEAVRLLDAAHLERVEEVHEHFENEFELARRSSIQRQFASLKAGLEAADVLLIAGGHVAILVNRLRMFGLGDLIAQKPVIAWAAGAMALSERVVLFHDSPPQGAGDAEVFQAGFALVPNLVCLPHASRRLKLEDRSRVSLMARRFAPAVCATLDPPAELSFEGGALRELGESKRLCDDGLLSPVGAA